MSYRVLCFYIAFSTSRFSFLFSFLLFFHSLPRGFDSLRSLFLVSFPDGLHSVTVVVLHQNAPLPAPRRQPDSLVTRVLRRQILLRVRGARERRDTVRERVLSVGG